ncbi:MAG: hypothetical protein HDS97_03310 [Bacteroidales bacterium]|nr:hypothetical protein [Bacteroidales bacterium]
MENPFTQQLYQLYFDFVDGKGKSRLRAFCILLNSINFVPSERFVENILYASTRSVAMHRLMMLDGSILKIKNSKYRLDISDIYFILQALFILNTRLSFSLLNRLCDCIHEYRMECYLIDLFKAYFRIIERGLVEEFNKMEVNNKINYLIKTHLVCEFPSLEKKNKINIPVSYTHSNIWDSNVIRNFKAIPIAMGGTNRNKKL